MVYCAANVLFGRLPFLSQQLLKTLEDSFDKDELRLVAALDQLSSLGFSLAEYSKSESGEENVDLRRFFNLGMDRFVIGTFGDLSTLPAPDTACVKGNTETFITVDAPKGVNVGECLKHGAKLLGSKWMVLPFEAVHTSYSNKKTTRAIQRNEEWLSVGMSIDSTLLLLPVYGRPNHSSASCVEKLTQAIKEAPAGKQLGIAFCNLGGLSATDREAFVRQTFDSLQSAGVAQVVGENSFACGGSLGPLDVLRLWQLGVSTVETSLPYFATKMGHALCFQTTELKQAGKQEVLINLRERVYEKDKRPLRQGCGCWGCQNHTRSYVHHLLIAREMLGEMILCLHNLYQMFDLARAFRECSDAPSRESYVNRWIQVHSEY